MSTMRAKFVVSNVEKFDGSERVTFRAVGKSSSYPDDGSDEDNTFARFTPSADLTIHIVNPTLLGQFEPDQKFYADFTPVEQG
ncbi:hypothetical protein [Lysobacter capsici]|uniref:hypothetical protein n=1 Tax=Lysobacter capsici TaxID=435897 RepID=UPI00287BB567|nr:hypothetical protein [Lysobacter capsici]WND79400.1 hypothetical protein RJ610_19165 [Lysobacter capsici]WND84596.1 hypothetical protein RJ609_19180 [Lysobacter capsici]